MKLQVLVFCSVMSRRCENLLLQIYLHFPEVIQHVRMPDATLSGEAAADGSTCKVLTKRPQKPAYFR